MKKWARESCDSDSELGGISRWSPSRPRSWPVPGAGKCHGPCWPSVACLRATERLASVTCPCESLSSSHRHCAQPAWGRLRLAGRQRRLGGRAGSWDPAPAGSRSAARPVPGRLSVGPAGGISKKDGPAEPTGSFQARTGRGASPARRPGSPNGGRRLREPAPLRARSEEGASA